MTDIDRPLGITIIAIIACIGGLIGALSIVIEFADGPAAGIWNLIRTIFNFTAAYGLWYLKKWAYPSVILMYTFLLFGNAIMFLVFGVGAPNNIFSSVLIFGVMIYYIYTKSDKFQY